MFRFSDLFQIHRKKRVCDAYMEHFNEFWTNNSLAKIRNTCSAVHANGSKRLDLDASIVI